MSKKKYFTEEEKKKAKQEYDKIYCKKYKEIRNKKAKEYYQKHRERYLEEKRKYRKTHSKEIKDYRNKRMKTDIKFKLICYLRSRLSVAVRNNQKSGSAVKDLGCSIPELKIYLESKFQVGMTWENWGINGWHIDHIIPLDSFNLQNKDEFLKASHYTNLQPMWAEENWEKGNKIILDK
ncbi:MAG: hypothetical protein WC495_05910 [Patescibacteria group bacterium]|jgi:hypothetical protein